MAGFFGLTGLLNGLWGACLPATDARLDLGPARLAVVLLVLALGTLVTMPVAGVLAERAGSRRLLWISAVLFAAALGGPAAAPGYPALIGAVLVMSLMLGLLNVALTVQAVDLERESARPVMSMLHGVWALGALTGGTATAAGLRAGVDSRLVLAVGAVLAMAALLALGPLLPAPAPRPAEPATPEAAGDGPRLRLVVMLGLIGAAAFLSENAATDWAGVHARRVLGADLATASLAYTFFFAAMTGTRLVGDPIRARLGAARVVFLAGLVASAGYGLVLATTFLTSGAIVVALAGWLLAGAGMALVWPVVSSTVGSVFPHRARGLSLVTTLAYGGGLLGPTVMGLVASATSLPVAMIVPAVLVLLVTVSAPPVLRSLTAVPVTVAGGAAAPAPAPRSEQSPPAGTRRW